MEAADGQRTAISRCLPCEGKAAGDDSSEQATGAQRWLQVCLP
jgi:hypothetical protein